MNSKRYELYDKLTDGLVIREHQAQYPEMTADMYEKAKFRYQSDNFFRARVDNLVAGIMSLIDEYAEFSEDSVLPQQKESK